MIHINPLNLVKHHHEIDKPVKPIIPHINVLVCIELLERIQHIHFMKHKAITPGTAHTIFGKNDLMSLLDVSHAFSKTDCIRKV